MKFFSNRTGGIVLAILFFAVIGFAFAANAADSATTTFKFQAQWPASPMGTDIAKETNPTVALGIKYIYEWGVGLGGLAVFIALIIAGFEYITSIGNPSKMQDAFNRIRDAVIGLVILLSSYAILSLIGINLNSIKITPFQENFSSQATTCKSAEKEPAPDCCKDKDGDQIKNCKDEYYTCIGYDPAANKAGYCWPRWNKAECKSAKIIYESGGDYSINDFDNEHTIDPKKQIGSVVFYSESNGAGAPCYDPTSDDESLRDTKNPVCKCGLQLFTKSSTNTGGGTTKECENTDIYVATNNESLKTYVNAKATVCVMLIKQ